jgi:hypothetical protein
MRLIAGKAIHAHRRTRLNDITARFADLSTDVRRRTGVSRVDGAFSR